MNFFDKYIGTKYRETDDEGNYLGCLLPGYLLYPDKPKYKVDESKFSLLFVMGEFAKVLTRIDKAEKFGDIILLRQFGKFHIYVVVNSSKAVHINRGGSLEYIHYEINSKDPRIIGVFR